MDKSEMAEIQRPLDLLHKLKQSKVIIKLKDGKEVVGHLLSFDIHINIVYFDVDIDDLRFIRGENIIYVNAYKDKK